MSYRKLAADRLFTGYAFADDQVLITDATGRVEALVDESEAGEGVEHFAGMLTPGFVNCHCHLELSHLSGAIPQHTGMVDFLLSVLKIRGQEPHPDAIAAAEEQMRRNGVVAVGDVCNTAHTVARKSERNLQYFNFIEVLGVLSSAASERLGQARHLAQVFAEPRSISPHAPYSVSLELMKLVNTDTPGTVLTIHNQESDAENELFQNASGDFLKLYTALGIAPPSWLPTRQSSLRSYLPFFSRQHSMILVHNTATSADDVRWIRERRDVLPNVFWCLCPNANLYIEGRLPDVPMLSDSGIPIVVGTDSLASNRELSVLSELAAIQSQWHTLPLSSLLGWATINGAEALQMQRTLGSFEKGKTPGVVLIEGMNEDRLSSARSRRIV